MPRPRILTCLFLQQTQSDFAAKVSIELLRRSCARNTTSQSTVQTPSTQTCPKSMLPSSALAASPKPAKGSCCSKTPREPCWSRGKAVSKPKKDIVGGVAKRGRWCRCDELGLARGFVRSSRIHRRGTGELRGQNARLDGDDGMGRMRCITCYFKEQWKERV